MKKIISLFAVLMLLSIAAITKAQTPQAIKYQAIARNASGEAIANQNVSFRISILQGSAEGAAVYQEIQTTTTNQFGLANLSIGMGNTTTGLFDSIKWGNATYFAKIEFDPKGGTDYTLMGTSQLLSVPYSLYAEHAKVADNLPVFPIKASLQATNVQAPFNAPETGMLVYNTDSAGTEPNNVVPGYYYNAGTATVPDWVLLSTDEKLNNKKPFSAPPYWQTNGDAGTVDGVNFLGTTDDVPLTIEVDGITAGRLDADLQNTFLGVNAGGPYYLGVTGSDNVAIGFVALQSITSGVENIAIGDGALNGNETAGYNIGIGEEALASNASGSYNVGIGISALADNSSGVANVGIGNLALSGNTAGTYNIGIGQGALQNNTTADNNTAIGSGALYTQSYNGGSTTAQWISNNTAIGNNALALNQPTSQSNGIENTAVGAYSLYYNIIGLNNTANGYEALYGSANSGSGITASSNAAVGAYALHKNIIGSWNTATGDSAMASNTSGIKNVAIGYQALASNQSGGYNTAVGYEALINTTGNYNTAMGYVALASNVSGINNSAFGVNALFTNASNNNTALGTNALVSNVSGNANNATGFGALYYNNSGSANVADGVNALYNTYGSNNTGVGYFALYSNSSGNGSDNTTLGYAADVISAGTVTNATAIGYGAQATTSNTVYIGNASLTGTYCDAGMYTVSDRRFKKNIQKNVPGLSFIMKLQPVTYNYNLESMAKFRHTPDSLRLKDAEAAKEKIQYSGFIAQDVEQAAKECGYDFSGVSKPKTDNDSYALSYEAFAVPLVKAIQEQQEMIDKQNAEIDAQNSEIDKQTKEIKELKRMVDELMKKDK